MPVLLVLHMPGHLVLLSSSLLFDGIGLSTAFKKDPGRGDMWTLWWGGETKAVTETDLFGGTCV